MEHQQSIGYQQDLFLGQVENSIIPSNNCKGVSQATSRQAKQINKEEEQRRALTSHLMTDYLICH